MSAEFKMKLSIRTLKYPQGRNHIFLIHCTNLALCEFRPNEILAFLYFAVKIIYVYSVCIFFLLPEVVKGLYTYCCTCHRI